MSGTPEQPMTLARVHAAQEYHEACERLANASVAKHRADAEFSEALRAYSEARGAARSQGIIT